MRLDQTRIGVMMLAPRIYPFFSGGFETAYYNLAIRLLRSGVEVFVLTQLGPKPMRSAFPFQAYLFRIGERLAHSSGLFGYVFRSLLYAAGVVVLLLVKRGKYQIVHSQSAFPEVSMLAVVAARFLGKKVVVWGRGGDIYAYPQQHGIIRRAVAWSLRHADVVIALSEDMKRKIEDIARRRDVVVIPNGVAAYSQKPVSRVEMLSKLGLSEADASKRFVLYAGRVDRFKGVEFLLKAVPKILSHCPEAHLVIAGKGRELQRLQTFALKLVGSGSVSFVGQLPHAELMRWLPNFEVFVYPEMRGQGISNAILETMACGLPVVASDVGAIPEVVSHGVTGFLVPPGNPEAIADAVIETLSSDELRMKMQAAAREAVAARFSWDAVVNRLIAVYQRVLR